MRSEKPNLGVYWSEASVYFSEILGNTPTQSFSLPHKQQSKNERKGGEFTELRPLTARLQDALLERGIKKPTVYLSLPTKDIIFRSFVIPWMPLNEIKNVVSFEASKYVPFALEDLSYSFYPVLITRDNAKRYRIIFVAIKKEVLEDYKNILNHAGLNISVIEPSAMSLIRLLAFKNLIPEEQTIALIEKYQNTGKIAIISKGTPHFVREFFLTMATPQGAEEVDAQTLYLRLVNEIKISLDYFNRQDNQLEVKEVLLLSNESNGELAKKLESDLGMTIRSTSINTLMPNNAESDINYMNSLGAGLLGSMNAPVTFDLSGNEIKSPRLQRDRKAKPLNIKLIAITAIACGLLLAGAFSISKFVQGKHASQLKSLKSQLGIFDGASKDSIESQNKTMQTKLAEYQKIRANTSVTSFLDVIPDLLPEGTWLEELNIEYKKLQTSIQAQNSTPPPTEEKLEILMMGYVYSENPREQFRLANSLLRNIKQEDVFGKQFKTIDFKKTQTQNIEEYTVTYFEIKCE